MSNIFKKMFDSLKDFLFPTPEQQIKKLVKQKEKIDLKISALKSKIKKPIEKKVKEQLFSKWFNVEMYVTIKNEQARDTSMDGGFILVNCKEENVAEASDIFKNMPVKKIKQLLNLSKGQVILEVHHGISKSQTMDFYLDINGERQTLTFNNFEAIKGVLK